MLAQKCLRSRGIRHNETDSWIVCGLGCCPFNGIFSPHYLCSRKADSRHTDQCSQSSIGSQRKNLSFTFFKKRDEEHATHSALSKQISGYRETSLYSCFPSVKDPEAQTRGSYNPR